jgi:uncharacterized RDD family membrane protein YckC
MREPRREDGLYPKADLSLRLLARLADFTLSLVISQAIVQAGPLLAAAYLLAADGLLAGQSIGKRIFGLRTMNVRRRAPAGYVESALRNAPFALVAIFYAVPFLWPVLLVAGAPILAFETWMVFSDRDGVRIGDILADTQVVDGKVLSREAELSRGLATPAPAPPGPSATAVGAPPPLPPSRAAA